jgi:hypothetical protein
MVDSKAISLGSGRDGKMMIRDLEGGAYASPASPAAKWASEL